MMKLEKYLKALWKPTRKLSMFWLLTSCIFFTTVFLNQYEIRKCLVSTDIDQCFFVGKTAWEWLELLVAPGLLATIGILAERYFKNRDENKLSQEREIVKDAKRQTTLKEYFEKMTELLLDSKWPDSNKVLGDEDKPIIAVARARTLAILRELDSDRKRSVIQFIIESGSIKKISLDSADLSSTDLSYISLTRANLSEASLSNTNFQNTNLSETNLSRADIRNADFSNTNLSSAEINEANLSYANLTGVDLSKANLSYANLTGVDLNEANLSYANLTGVDLSKANLSYANLTGVDLSKANLSYSNLTEANLSRVQLAYADLSDANLTKANLRGAMLVDHSIRYPKLSIAKFSKTNLSKAKGISDEQRSVFLEQGAILD